MKTLGSSNDIKPYIDDIIANPSVFPLFLEDFKFNVQNNTSKYIVFPTFDVSLYLQEIETRKNSIELKKELGIYGENPSEDLIKNYKESSIVNTTGVFLSYYILGTVNLNNFLRWLWGVSSAENPREPHIPYYNNIYDTYNRPDILPNQEQGCQCDMVIIEL